MFHYQLEYFQVFIISITCILWCCVTKDDDATVFAKVGILVGAIMSI